MHSQCHCLTLHAALYFKLHLPTWHHLCPDFVCNINGDCWWLAFPCDLYTIMEQWGKQMSPYIHICCVTCNYRYNRVTDDIINVHYLSKQLDIAWSRIKTMGGILLSIVADCRIALITSLAKEIMFLVALVCLFVCEHHYSKSYEQVGMKFYGRVLGSAMKNWLNFGGGPGIRRWVNELKTP